MRAVGAQFETLVAKWLRSRGWRVLDRNFTCKGGELDLVCDDAGTTVFVEVRARANARYGTPAETVGAIKRQRLVLAARHWLHRHGGEDHACRFDVVAVEDGTITHLADAFDVSTC